MELLCGILSNYLHGTFIRFCIKHAQWYACCIFNDGIVGPCRLKDLHQRCTKEMDGYVGCLYYYTNEFDLCRKEQQEFEKACPLEWENKPNPMSTII